MVVLALREQSASLPREAIANNRAPMQDVKGDVHLQRIGDAELRAMEFEGLGREGDRASSRHVQDGCGQPR